jgi:hypothetical protein
VKAIKDERLKFHADISPFEILRNNFADESNYSIVYNPEAHEYLKVSTIRDNDIIDEYGEVLF